MICLPWWGFVIFAGALSVFLLVVAFVAFTRAAMGALR